MRADTPNIRAWWSVADARASRAPGRTRAASSSVTSLTNAAVSRILHRTPARRFRVSYTGSSVLQAHVVAVERRADRAAAERQQVRRAEILARSPVSACR